MRGLPAVRAGGSCGVEMASEVSDIVPDDKDWTFVIADGCAECGFVPGAVEPTTIGDRLRATVGRWAAVLDRADVTLRPSPQVWSPLEYGCHVRDVVQTFGGRVRLMLDVDGAEFANWDQDQSAVDGRYGEQDPSTVAVGYASDVDVTAGIFDGVPPYQWQRRGRRSNGSAFTVETIGVYFLHDIEHHLYDVAG